MSLSKKEQLKSRQVKKKTCLQCNKDRDLKFFTSTRAKYCIHCLKKKKLQKKRTSPKVMKAKAWKMFSTYIRLRDCLKTTGTLDKGVCITCGKLCDFKELQAGHYIGGRGNSVLFDEKIVNGQCLTKHSNVRTTKGNKSISKIKKGDELLAFNEKTFVEEKAEVVEVSSFIPDELYKIELEDGFFYATPDHRVVINNNWVRVDELLVGMDIKEYKTNEPDLLKKGMTYKNAGKALNMPYSTVPHLIRGSRRNIK
jgi:hypothetical protein